MLREYFQNQLFGHEEASVSLSYHTLAEIANKIGLGAIFCPDRDFLKMGMKIDKNGMKIDEKPARTSASRKEKQISLLAFFKSRMAPRMSVRRKGTISTQRPG
jgi:hypothetical protein